MGSTKHEKTFVDYEKGYENNLIGLKGVIWFGAGLVVLIVITFGLMFLLQNAMEDQAKKADAEDKNPMMVGRSKEDRLPPEPRLQVAPGFGVGEGKDRVNFELKAPQSEYWELEKRWKKEWAEGQKDEKTGTVISLPIEEAKKRLLQENIKTRQDGQKVFDDSRTFYSYSSAGRLASDKRR